METTVLTTPTNISEAKPNSPICVIETTVLTTPTDVSEAKPHSPIHVTHTKSHMTSIPIESDEEDMLMEVFNTDKEK